MFSSIIKRDGRTVPYDIHKISHAISQAMQACGRQDEEESLRLAELVEDKLRANFGEESPGVEAVQDLSLIHI